MTTDQISLIVTIALLVLGLVIALLVLKRVRAGRPGDAPGTVPAPPGVEAPARTAAPEAAPAMPPQGVPSPFLAAPTGEPDDLGRIKGIGPKLSARLRELGVFHYAQIAGWTPEQMALVDAELGSFQGRPERDQWQSQAALLASGDIKAYERVHGKLGPDA
jgi:predicted flap endonuclease-1-like 5' DNA nuclease